MSSPLGNPADGSLAPAESGPPWPSTRIIAALITVTYLSSLILIWVISADIHLPITIRDGSTGSITGPIDLASYADIAIVGIVVFWIAFSISRSLQNFLECALLFGLLLYVMLALIFNQNRLTFWIAFLMLVAVGLPEVYEQFRSRTLLRGTAQVLLILLLWLTLLHVLTKYLLLLPQDFFAIVIDYVTQIRLILLSLFGLVVVLATIAKVLPKFSWPHKRFIPEFDEKKLVAVIIQPVIATINALLNFFVNASAIFFDAVLDAFTFIKEVFFDRRLWGTILRVGFIAFWSFAIPYCIVFVEPYAETVLRTPSLLGRFDAHLALSNLLVGIMFLIIAGAVLGLGRAWLLREPNRKLEATERTTNGAVVIYIFTWVATLTYFYPINLSFGLHPDLLFPGLYTLLIFPLALAGFLIGRRRRTSDADYSALLGKQLGVPTASG